METYSIYYGDGVIAKELTLTNCLIMIEALFKTYSNQKGLALTILKEEYKEPVADQEVVEQVEQEKEI